MTDKLLPEKPTALTPIFENVPNELTQLNQWVCWRYVYRKGKWTKPPYTPTNQNASTTNHATWSTFEQVKHAYLNPQNKFDGVGFVFNGDHSGVDADHTTEIDDLIKAINSYAEYSPSGEGIHIYVNGQVNPLGKRKANFEVYSIGRFFAVTGHKHPLAPTTLSELNGAVHKLYDQLSTNSVTPNQPQEVQLTSSNSLAFTLATQALNDRLIRDHIFASVWSGNAKYNSTSEAVLGLRTDLLRLTYGDQELADSLFRTSPLYAINPSKYDRTAKYEYPKAFERINSQLTNYSQPQTSRFTTISLCDAFNQQPPKWLFKYYLIANESNVLFAPSGMGKTAFAVWLAVQLALQGKHVLYGAMENYPGVAARLKAYTEHLQLDATQLPLTLFNTPFYLNGNGDADELIRAYQSTQYDLIIFDTLTNITKGSLLKDDIVKEAFDSIRKIERGLGCASWTLTHTGWTNQDREAGSMSLRNNSSHTLGLETLDVNNNTLKVLFAKTRHFDTNSLPDITLKLKSATTEMQGQSFTGVWAEPEETQSWVFTSKLSTDCITVLQILKSVETANFTALLDLTHWDKKRLSKATSILKGRSLVSKEDRKSPYSITDSGLTALD